VSISARTIRAHCPDFAAHHLADRVVERDQPRGVPLAQQDQAERRRQAVRVGAFGQPIGRAAPGHRAARVHQDHRAQVGLLLVLLDEEAVRAREDLPVEVARLVAGLVGTVLGEFDGEPPERRAVEPGEEALDHAPGHDLDAPQARDLGWVQQVEATHRGHGARKLTGGQLSAAGDRTSGADPGHVV
jgi:hypothetical protein